VKVLSRVFRGKFVAGLKTAFHRDKLEFYGYLAPLAEPRIFAAWLRCLFRHDWVVYAKPPFGGPEPRCAISVAIPTASPSPTADSSPSTKARSPSADEIPRTAISSASSLCRSTNSCAASCFTCYHAASCESATSAFSPTDDVLA
jgi:hypothetical protein